MTNTSTSQKQKSKLRFIFIPLTLIAMIFSGVNAISARKSAQAADTTTPSIIKYKPVSSVVTIDGSDSEPFWSNQPTNIVNGYSNATITNPSDLSGNFKSTWDANNLYLFVQVIDDQVNIGPSSSTMYDGIDIYVDANGSRGATYSSGDCQYRINRDQALITADAGGCSTVGIEKAQMNISGGYNLEIKIPWMTVGLASAPAKDSKIGLDILIKDGENDKFINYTTGHTPWTTPNDFGVFTMDKTGVCSSSSTSTSTSSPVTSTSTSTSSSVAATASLDAVNDSFSISNNTNGTGIDVLANDISICGTKTVLSINGVPIANGTGNVVVNNNLYVTVVSGSLFASLVVYPINGFVGSQNFTYTIGGCNGQTDTAVVSINVLRNNSTSTTSMMPSSTSTSSMMPSSTSTSSMMPSSTSTSSATSIVKPLEYDVVLRRLEATLTRLTQLVTKLNEQIQLLLDPVKYNDGTIASNKPVRVVITTPSGRRVVLKTNTDSNGNINIKYTPTPQLANNTFNFDVTAYAAINNDSGFTVEEGNINDLSSLGNYTALAEILDTTTSQYLQTNPINWTIASSTSQSVSMSSVSMTTTSSANTSTKKLLDVEYNSYYLGMRLTAPLDRKSAEIISVGNEVYLLLNNLKYSDKTIASNKEVNINIYSDGGKNVVIKTQTDENGNVMIKYSTKPDGQLLINNNTPYSFVSGSFSDLISLDNYKATVDSYDEVNMSKYKSNEIGWIIRQAIMTSNPTSTQASVKSVATSTSAAPVSPISNLARTGGVALLGFGTLVSLAYLAYSYKKASKRNQL